MRTYTACPECGSRTKHKKTCSRSKAPHPKPSRPPSQVRVDPKPLDLQSQPGVGLVLMRAGELVGNRDYYSAAKLLFSYTIIKLKPEELAAAMVRVLDEAIAGKLNEEGLKAA